MSKVINVTRRDDGHGFVAITFSEVDGYAERMRASDARCAKCDKPVESAIVNYQLDGEWCHSWCLPPEVTSHPKFPS